MLRAVIYPMICLYLIVARVVYTARGIIEPSIEGRPTHSLLLSIMIRCENSLSPLIQKLIDELHHPKHYSSVM